MSTIYYPPCNCSFGNYMVHITCMGAPGHKGDHHDREEGIRWNGYGRKVRRCSWRSCSDPDRVLISPDRIDRVHLCPGSPAHKEWHENLIRQGWTVESVAGGGE